MVGWGGEAAAAKHEHRIHFGENGTAANFAAVAMRRRRGPVEAPGEGQPLSSAAAPATRSASKTSPTSRSKRIESARCKSSARAGATAALVLRRRRPRAAAAREAPLHRCPQVLQRRRYSPVRCAPALCRRTSLPRPRNNPSTPLLRCRSRDERVPARRRPVRSPLPVQRSS